FFKAVEVMAGFQIVTMFEEGLGPWIVICQACDGWTWAKVKEQLNERATGLAPAAKYGLSDGVLFNKNKTTLICCPGAKAGHYAIPGGVITLASSAFDSCTNLASANWTGLHSCTLTNGLIYFADSSWTNYPTRLYRVRSP
ncbi:MAG: hypothetical protein ABUL66_00460, partial [Verrucomicrobiota bacterium]